MHHQRVVDVDPERELLLARHPPQIHSLQPVKNQPENHIVHTPIDVTTTRHAMADLKF